MRRAREVKEVRRLNQAAWHSRQGEKERTVRWLGRGGHSEEEKGGGREKNNGDCEK